MHSPKSPLVSLSLNVSCQTALLLLSGNLLGRRLSSFPHQLKHHSRPYLDRCHDLGGHGQSFAFSSVEASRTHRNYAHTFAALLRCGKINGSISSRWFISIRPSTGTQRSALTHFLQLVAIAPTYCPITGSSFDSRRVELLFITLSIAWRYLCNEGTPRRTE